MPIYEYECSNSECEAATFETRQSIKDDALIICPFCNQESIHRIPSIPMYISIPSQPKTLGALADRNRDKMSESQYQEKMKKMSDERMTLNEFKGKLNEGAEPMKKLDKTPPWRKGPVDIKLASLPPDKLEKYIMTGKK